MTIKPLSAIFGYYSPVNGRRVDDPPEIAAAIHKARSREVPWAMAERALVELGSKPRLPARINYEDGTHVIF